MASVVSPLAAGETEDAARPGNPHAERVAVAVREHHAFVFRLLRRLGVPETGAEDTLQEVYCVYARRVAEIEPGKDRTFLFGVAIRIARSARRTLGQARETPDDETIASIPTTDASPEEQLDDRRARALLDGLLDRMTTELRTVFVLYELEELTMQEIATMLGVPTGTVASRLHRARDDFQRLSRRLAARMGAKGTPR
jgi:RNA polymerase sigma-70 factor (ECF subfamily)